MFRAASLNICNSTPLLLFALRSSLTNMVATEAGFQAAPDVGLEDKSMDPASDASSISSFGTPPSTVPVQSPEQDPEKQSTHHTQRSSTPNPDATQGITTAQDWTGPNDEGNPHNWSLGKKLYHLIMVGFQAFTTYVKFAS